MLFNRVSNLFRHHREKHVEQVNEYKCLFTNCNKTYKRQQSLTTHMRWHTGERPYICRHPGCAKTFRAASTQTEHQRAHTEKKPYTREAPGCMRTYTNQSSLQRHIQASLMTHMRLHMGERPYICGHPGCAKAFRAAATQTRHQRTHTGERPYICEAPGCMRAYTDQSTLRKHIQMTHGPKFYVRGRYEARGPSKDYSNKREGFRPETAGPSYHSNEKPTLERTGGTGAPIGKNKVAKSSNTTTTATPSRGNDEQKYVKTDCHWRGCNLQFYGQDRLVKHINGEHIAANKKSLNCKWENCTRE